MGALPPAEERERSKGDTLRDKMLKAETSVLTPSQKADTDLDGK